MVLSKRQNGYYYIYYHQSNGRRTSVSTKSKIKTEALKFLSNFEKEIKIKSQKKSKVILLNDLINDFLDYSFTIHKRKTYEGYKISLKYLINYTGNIPIKEITTEKLNNYFEYRLKISSIYQARKDFICINHMLNRAKAEGCIEFNSCDKIKRFKIPQKLPLFFTEMEFELLMKTIDSKVIREIALFAVQTGMRQNEIINLKWSQVNFKDAYVILDNQNSMTKNNKIRTIPLTIKAINILQERKFIKYSDFVFTYKGKKINQDYLSRKFHKYVVQAKLNPKLNFHSLRHTFASWLVQKGVSIYEVQKLLGHSSIAVTQIYAHLHPNNLRFAIDKLNGNYDCTNT